MFDDDAPDVPILEWMSGCIRKSGSDKARPRCRIIYDDGEEEFGHFSEDFSTFQAENEGQGNDITRRIRWEEPWLCQIDGQQRVIGASSKPTAGTANGGHAHSGSEAQQGVSRAPASVSPSALAVKRRVPAAALGDFTDTSQGARATKLAKLAPDANAGFTVIRSQPDASAKGPDADAAGADMDIRPARVPAAGADKSDVASTPGDAVAPQRANSFSVAAASDVEGWHPFLSAKEEAKKCKQSPVSASQFVEGEDLSAPSASASRPQPAARPADVAVAQLVPDDDLITSGAVVAAPSKRSSLSSHLLPPRTGPRTVMMIDQPLTKRPPGAAQADACQKSLVKKPLPPRAGANTTKAVLDQAPSSTPVQRTAVRASADPSPTYAAAGRASTNGGDTASKLDAVLLQRARGMSSDSRSTGAQQEPAASTMPPSGTTAVAAGSTQKPLLSTRPMRPAAAPPSATTRISMVADASQLPSAGRAAGVASTSGASASSTTATGEHCGQLKGHDTFITSLWLFWWAAMHHVCLCCCGIY